jgi:hypothetical protein
MSNTPAQQAGCFVATYPSTRWQASPCVTAPLVPLLSSLPSTVGYGVDEVARSSGTSIGSSFGSFQSITGLTSETDVCVAPFLSLCGNGQGTNRYTLQDNTNTFTTSTTYTGGKSATGWEQFVYTNYVTCQGTLCSGCLLSGCILIQYWLLGYGSSCPSTGPPGGSSWIESSGSCYANSPAYGVPSEAASNLANLVLKGYANFGSNDEVVFCISGGSCYAVAITYQVLNLYQHWLDAEFNVVGWGNGSQADFNSGTSITVVNTLKDQGGNVIVPSCVNTGTTGETNNLNLVPNSCTPNSSNGQIVFTESNAPQTLTTSVASGPGSVLPSCPSGCSEGVGSSISVSATPSANWQFSSWSTSGASCSAGSLSNPCAFTMPNNPVTISVRFTQLPAVSTDLTTYSQGDTIHYTGSGFTPNNQVHACLTTNPSSATCFTNEPNADSSGNVAGSFMIDLNWLTGPQQFWVYDVSSSTNSNSIQLTILELTVVTTQTIGTTSTSTSFTTTSSTSTQRTTTTTTTTSTRTTVQGLTCVVSTTTTTATSVTPLVATTTSLTTSTGTTTTLTTSTYSTTTAITSTSTSLILTTTTLTPCVQSDTSTSTITTISTSIIPKVTMTLSYLVVGGGNPSAPTFNYVRSAAVEALTLTANPTPISVDAGSVWSVTPSALSSSSSMERWQSNQALSGTASAATIVFTFYHQFSETVSYSVVGGGTGYSAPTFTSSSFGASAPQTLTTTPTSYWFDNSVSWLVTNPLSGSTSSEQWATSHPASGTIASSQTIAFSYQHQYMLTMQVSPPGGGTTTPTTGWQNAGAGVTIQATPNSGFTFFPWIGSGSGAYSGLSNPATVTMNGPMTEVANFQAATIISNDIPTLMATGQSYTVHVSVRNDGGSTWTSASNFKLGSVADAVPFGPTRVTFDSSESVATGQQYTFAFILTPTSVGKFTLQYQMLQEGVARFGQIVSVAVSVQVGNDAVVVSNDIPTSMIGGQSYVVHVVVQNTALNTWTSAGSYKLSSVSDNPPLGPARVSLDPSASVADGQGYTFTFTITAPMNAGGYMLQYQMLEEGVARFGQTLTVNVKVVAPVSGWVSSSFLAALPVSGALSSGPHGDQSTTSTTFTPSEEGVSVVAGGGQQYLVLGTSQLWDSSPGIGASMGICRDGVLVSGDQFSLGATAGHRHLASAIVVDTPSAGSHTYTLCFKTDPSGTGFVSSTYLVLVPVSGAFQSGPHGDQSTTSTVFTPSLENVPVAASGSQQYLVLASSQLWSDSVGVGSSVAVCRDGVAVSGDMFELGSTLGHRLLPLAVAVDSPTAGSHTYTLCYKTDPGGRGWVSSTFLVVVPVSGASSSGPFGDQSTTSTTFTASHASMSVSTSGSYLLVGTSQLWNDASTVGSSIGVCRDGILVSGDQFSLGPMITHRHLASALALDTPSPGSHTYSLCFKTDPGSASASVVAYSGLMIPVMAPTVRDERELSFPQLSRFS